MSRANTTAIPDEEMIGERIDMLVVTGIDLRDHNRRWVCKCDCGEEVIKTTSDLRRKTLKIKSCGCFDGRRGGRERPEMIGEKYNRLTVLKYIEDISLQRKKDFYEVICDCGTKKVVMGGNLRSNAIKSCGCLRSEATIRKNKDPFVYRDRVGKHKPAKKWTLTEEEQKFVVKNMDLPEKLFPGNEDKQADGYLGLCNAVHYWFEKPDGEKTKDLPDFRKYATAVIYNVVAGTQSKVPLIAVPDRPVQLRRTISKLRNLYYTKTGQKLPNADLAKLLDITLDELQDITIENKIRDLSSPISNKDDRTLSDIMPDKQQKNPLEQLIEREEQKITKIKELRMELKEQESLEDAQS